MITIVMPTFNQKDYIIPAIESIVNQIFQEWELIIVDDASSDGTFSLVHSAFNDSRITYLRLDNNGGTGNALNQGFKLGNYEIETWWASDNIMYPDMLHDLYKDLILGNADFAYSHCDIGIMDKSGLNEIKRNRLDKEVGSQVWDPNKFRHHYYIGICWLWRKSLRMKAGEFFQEEPCEDYDMVLRMMQAGGKFYFEPKTLGWFRRHPNNISARIKNCGVDYSRLVKEKAVARGWEGVRSEDIID